MKTSSAKTQIFRAESLLLVFPFLRLVAGGCTKYDASPGDNGLYAIKCTCTEEVKDYDVISDNSVLFLNATSLEILQCRNVTLRPNLFRRSYHLQDFTLSSIEHLSIDPALSMPQSLNKLRLSHIGYVDHFPVPGPHSRFLQSVHALETLELENITVASPGFGFQGSTFVDLPIRRVSMDSVSFVGTLGKGVLEFNDSAMISYLARKCHFGDMNESSLFIFAEESVVFEDCEFGIVASGAAKVRAKEVTLKGNRFRLLRGPNAISLMASRRMVVSENSVTSLEGADALTLDDRNNATVSIEENLLPCGCYAENFVQSMLNKANSSNCHSSGSFLSCALLREQWCIPSPGGKREKILVTRFEVSHCPAESAATSQGIRLPLAESKTFMFLLVLSSLLMV